MNALSRLPEFRLGKIRDTYRVPRFRSTLVQRASDRLSTHNVVHLSEIPDKGEILTALTLFWKLEVFPADLPTHIIEWGASMAAYLPAELADPSERARTLIIRQCVTEPHEFVYRNYLTGSLWKAYLAGKDPYGLNLPPGLEHMHRFTESIFTPTHKSEHDEPLHADIVELACPEETALVERVCQLGEEHLAKKGIGLIDTKCEVGRRVLLDGRPGTLLLIDEWLTGDSSRMARLSDIQPGTDAPTLDKEPCRREAEKMWGDGPHVPLEFPSEVIKATSDRYHEAFEMITGRSLSGFQRFYMR